MWKVLFAGAQGIKAVRRIKMAMIDGKKISAETRAQIALDAQKLMAETGIRPGLAVVIVGDDPAFSCVCEKQEERLRAGGLLF